jgi:hypothetical protein
MPSQCKHEETRIIIEADGPDDIEKTVCANDECGYVLKEEIVVERPDGTTQRRPRHVRLEDQPEQFQFFKNGKAVSPEEKILSARDMALLAVQTREETVGKKARELVKTILDECIEKVLVGEHRHQIKPEDEIPGEILTLALKELRAQGYKVKKTPEPGAGVWVEVKWPTTVRKSRKTKQPAAGEISFPKEKKPLGEPDRDAQQKQQAAAKHRQKALKARSDSPE